MRESNNSAKASVDIQCGREHEQCIVDSYKIKTCSVALNLSPSVSIRSYIGKFQYSFNYVTPTLYFFVLIQHFQVCSEPLGGSCEALQKLQVSLACLMFIFVFCLDMFLVGLHKMSEHTVVVSGELLDRKHT